MVVEMLYPNNVLLHEWPAFVDQYVRDQYLCMVLLILKQEFYFNELII